MAIDGRINVDVLFHDTDGTTSLKVVSLEDSTAYTTGKVAIASGTCSTAALVLNTSSSFSEDASGQPVSFTTVSRIAFRSNPGAALNSGFVRFAVSKNNQIAVVSNPLNDNIGPGALQVNSLSGTASYTIILYGT